MDSFREQELAIKKLEVLGAISCEDAALICGMGVKALQKATRDGKITASKPNIYGEAGNFAYYSKESIRAFMLGYEKATEPEQRKRTLPKYGQMKT